MTVEQIAIVQPNQGQFKETGATFLEAPELESIVDDLVTSFEELTWLQAYRFRVLWKRKGGLSAGRNVYARTAIASGLVGFFAHCDYVIWVGVDTAGLTFDGDVEKYRALLYHELCHCDRTEDDQPAIVGHELEMFTAEVERFGLWTAALEKVAPVMAEQLALFGGVG